MDTRFGQKYHLIFENRKGIVKEIWGKCFWICSLVITLRVLFFKVFCALFLDIFWFRSLFRNSALFLNATFTQSFLTFSIWYTLISFFHSFLSNFCHQLFHPSVHLIKILIFFLLIKWLKLKLILKLFMHLFKRFQLIL